MNTNTANSFIVKTIDQQPCKGKIYHEDQYSTVITFLIFDGKRFHFQQVKLVYFDLLNTWRLRN